MKATDGDVLRERKATYARLRAADRAAGRPTGPASVQNRRCAAHDLVMMRPDIQALRAEVDKLWHAWRRQIQFTAARTVILPLYWIAASAGDTAEAWGIEAARVAARTLVSDGADRADITPDGGGRVVEWAVQGRYGGIEIRTNSTCRSLA